MGLTPAEYSAGAEKKELTPEQRARRKQAAMGKAIALLLNRVQSQLPINGHQMPYSVCGSQGDTYSLVLTEEEVTCSCKAGEFGTPCYHASLAELHLAVAGLVQGPL